MAKDDISTTAPMAFPAGAGYPHEYDKWFKWLQNAIIENKLLDIAMHRVPDGKFKALHPTSSLLPIDPPPKNASWSDKVKYRSYCDTIEHRRSENASIMAERTDWWNSGNNEYFHLFTSTMEKTAPNLREGYRPRRYPRSRAARPQAWS